MGMPSGGFGRAIGIAAVVFALAVHAQGTPNWPRAISLVGASTSTLASQLSAKRKSALVPTGAPAGLGNDAAARNRGGGGSRGGGGGRRR